MPHREILGRRVNLCIRRIAAPGAFLALDEDERPGAPTLLLPGAEIPPGKAVGDEVEVFVHLDSESRPIATTVVSKVELGEVAFLDVTAVTDIGAFVDWGLGKELLVPFAEQTTDLFVGARHPFGLYLDDSGRLAGTMRVSEMLAQKGEFALDEWVEGEAWRNEPDIGLFVIVERSFVGKVPASEPHALRRGEAARFRVSSVLPDGKIELSLRGHAHEEIARDAKTMLAVLARLEGEGVAAFDEKSSPETIREVFGLSKKAFKRAAGRLLKERSITVDDQGRIALTRRRDVR